jgi:hypothetical protein
MKDQCSTGLAVVCRGGSRNQRKGGPENFVLRENLQDHMQIQFVNILFPKTMLCVLGIFLKIKKLRFSLRIRV